MKLTQHQSRPQHQFLAVVGDCPLVPPVNHASTTPQGLAVILLSTVRVSARLWMARHAAASPICNAQTGVKSVWKIQTTVVIHRTVARIVRGFAYIQMAPQRHRPNTRRAAVCRDCGAPAVINSASTIHGPVMQTETTAALWLPIVQESVSDRNSSGAGPLADRPAPERISFVWTIPEILAN